MDAQVRSKKTRREGEGEGKERESHKNGTPLRIPNSSFLGFKAPVASGHPSLGWDHSKNSHMGTHLF